jgi:hypothetical protein
MSNNQTEALIPVVRKMLCMVEDKKIVMQG